MRSLIYIADESEGGAVHMHDATTHGVAPDLGVNDTRFGVHPHNQLAAGDVDGNGTDEVLVVDHTTSTVFSYDASTGQLLPNLFVFSTAFDNDGHNQLETGDVNGDGRDEILIADQTQNGRIHVYDATTHGLAPAFGVAATVFDRAGHNQLAAGDVNDDGRDEILVADQVEEGRVFVYDALTDGPVSDLGVEDTRFNNHPNNQLAVGDVDGDGREEVLIADASDLGGGAIHVYDAVTGGTASGLGVDDTRFDDDGHNQFAVGRFGRGDLDADGIPDQVELGGIRDSSGVVVMNLRELGASPCRKTVVVESDYLFGLDAAGNPDPAHTHKPERSALDQVKGAFANSPPPAVANCPYPGVDTSPGMALIVDDREGIVEDATTADLDVATGFQPLKDGHFHPAKRPYVHYGLWGHKYTGTCSSGLSLLGPDQKDFIVTIGNTAGVCDWGGATANSSVRNQSGTFMHELGHALGLHHGGGDGVNFKPNYLSIMNYRYQLEGLSFGPNIDFSRRALPNLDAHSLSEPAGIGQTTLRTHWNGPDGRVVESVAAGALDWTSQDRDGDGAPDPHDENGNGDPDDDTEVDVAVTGSICVHEHNASTNSDDGVATTAASDDIPATADRPWILAGSNHTCDTAADPTDTQSMQLNEVTPRYLTGFDDWSNIRFTGRGTALGHQPVPSLTSQQQAVLVSQADRSLRPDTIRTFGTPPAGERAASLGVTQDANRIYLVRFTAKVAEPHESLQPGELIVLDKATLRVIRRVTVGFNPESVAVNPVTGRVYVVNRGKQSYSLSVIDGTSLQVIATIPLGMTPIEVAVNPRTNRVYVSNLSQRVIQVVDGNTNQRLPDIQIGPGPLGIAVDQTTNRLYVALTNRAFEPNVNALGVVTDDGRTVEVHPPVPIPGVTQPNDVAVDPVHGRVYVANLGGGPGTAPSVSVLDTSTLGILASTTLSAPGRAITVNGESGLVFVATDKGVQVLDQSTNQRVRVMPAGIAFDITTAVGSDRQLYVVDGITGEFRRLSYSSGTRT